MPGCAKGESNNAKDEVSYLAKRSSKQNAEKSHFIVKGAMHPCSFVMKPFLLQAMTGCKWLLNGYYIISSKMADITCRLVRVNTCMNLH